MDGHRRTDPFEKFLDGNLNGTGPGIQLKGFRDGLFNLDFLLIDPNSFSDETLKYRFLYLRNLCLVTPDSFEIPQNLPKTERALMFLSFNNIKSALEALDTSFICKVTGTKARTRTGAEINVPVLECINTASQERIPYTAKGYKYENFTVQPLQYDELIYCFIKMIDILRNEDNSTLKKFKLTAYLNRVLMGENTLNIYFLRAFLLIATEIDNSTEKLEKIKNIPIPIDAAIFAHPITFLPDIMIQLGLAYKNRRYHKEAYAFLRPYPLYIERIDCLISLRQSQEAADEIRKFISLLEHSAEREDRFTCCELYIKLAHLCQEPSYFSSAFQIFRCSKPLYLKGLLHFKKGEFDEAIRAFEVALSLSPKDENIRFSYACGLIEIERISEAIKILKELKSENHMNEQVSRNLGYCYYKQDDIENTLLALKPSALNDPNVMSKYFLLSIKNEKIENIRWALLKISSADLIRGGVNYLLINGIMDEGELREILSKNPYINVDEVIIRPTK